MQKHTLQGALRTVTGRKAKTLRKQGILPANIYGKSISSLTIQIDADAFHQVFKKAGETGIVEITVDGKTYPTIIHNIQYHPVSHAPLHIDLFNVNLKEKIVAHVPLVIIGESQAVKDKVGTLLTMVNELEVEALPTDLPEHIDVDISHLTDVDQTLKVKDLSVGSKVEIINDLEQDVVKIAPLISKEAEEQMAQDAQKQSAETPKEGEESSEKKEEAQPPSESSVKKSSEEKS